MSNAESNEITTPLKTCLNCGNPNIVKDVPNALCADCREAAIKFPIPLWVKLFGGAILLLVIFSVINLPKSLTLGLDIERGIRADNEHKYATAEKYFLLSVKSDSDNLEANAHLFVAAYYNNDLETFFKVAPKISGKTLDDNDYLASQVNMLFDKAEYYYPSDSLYAIEQQYGGNLPDSVLENYINKHDDKVFAQTLYASKLFDEKHYRKSDSLLHLVINTDYQNLNALALMGSVKRFENQPDSAIFYCDKAIDLNNEFTYAKCLKARALLKQKRNNEAMDIVMQCKATDSTNAYTLATLALAYHCSSQPAQRDAVLNSAARMKDSASQIIFQYVYDVINRKDSL